MTAPALQLSPTCSLLHFKVSRKSGSIQCTQLKVFALKPAVKRLYLGPRLTNPRLKSSGVRLNKIIHNKSLFKKLCRCYPGIQSDTDSPTQTYFSGRFAKLVH